MKVMNIQLNKMDPDTFCPATVDKWRNWLQLNHTVKQGIWLIYNKKVTGAASVSWSEAVDTALCFGWIDGIARPIDENQYMQFFTKRKTDSGWSKINKEKVKKLISEGKMEIAGYLAVKTAKENGSWNILDKVELLIIPSDLKTAFKKFTGSEKYFKSLSKSSKKAMLQWISSAKKPATRENRIIAVAESSFKNLKPVNFR